MGEFFPARGAPRGPEVDDDDLAAEVGEGDGSAIQGGEGEFGRG